MSGWELVVGAASVSDSTSSKTVVADCAGGKKALGGGYTISGSVEVVAQSSYPSDDDTWTVVAVENDNEPGDWSVTAYVICATVLS